MSFKWLGHCGQKSFHHMFWFSVGGTGRSCWVEDLSISHSHVLHFNNANFVVIPSCYHSNQDPNLWVQALSYFAAKEENCKHFIVEVLSHIDRRNLLPPLLVIQTLAHNSTATLSVIKVQEGFNFYMKNMHLKFIVYCKGFRAVNFSR